ncbi:MAG: MFS transporter [Cyanobacteria bacterium P01_A01_bin.45]
MNSQNHQQRLKLPSQFWIVTSIAFINSVSFTIIIPLLYPYAKQFGLNDLQASLITTAYAVAQFIGTPILGKLSDKMGRKSILIISLSGTVIANILAALTPFVWLFYFARILDGLTGGNTSVATAVISDITTAQQRAKAFGIFGATFRLGFVAGPVLSYLAQQLPPLPGITPLGMSFIFAAIMALIATISTIFLLPETLPAKAKGNFNISWNDFGFIKVFQSVNRPKLGKLFILTFLSGTTFTIFAFAFQPFIVNVLDQDAKTLAVIFALVGILGFISQVLALEPLRKKLNLIDILSWALIIRGITFLLIPTFPTMGSFFIIISVFGLVNSFPMPLIDSILSLNSHKTEQGEILGTNSSYLSIANALGPFISGLLVSNGYLIPFWVTGVLTLLTAWFAISLKSEFKCQSKSAI